LHYKTIYDGCVKNRAVHFDFRWQRIPRIVNPRTGTTHATSMRRLVGVVRGPITSNRSNRVETSAAYITKTMHFLTFAALATHFVWSTTHRLWSVEKSPHALNALFASIEAGSIVSL